MPVHFFDTSAISKHYHAETGTAAHFQSADRLIRRIGLTKNLRTLDALQLAEAISVNEPGQPIEFVCADHALCNLAIAEGLSVVNPEVT